ncbi:MAG: hypothetical protein Q9191_005796 [Dirinaria sp. TL-2023a]
MMKSVLLLCFTYLSHAYHIKKHIPRDELTSDEAAAGKRCCQLVEAVQGFGILINKNLVSFANSETFQNQQNGSQGYWTQQEQSVIPTCRFTPNNAQDVSQAVSVLASANCKFAVRGGGHMSWAGAANIQSGVTIDLSTINAVSVSRDKTTTSVGAGARWEDVYLKLDEMNLAIPGGRVYDVGVGGLTLGGGNSYFAPRYGFACDNVKNYEIVLASGQIINANHYTFSDLFKALKGGSNNFGIVTRFDIRTFPQAKLWGGFIAYPYSSVPAQIQALQDFTTASGAEVDNYATVINAYIIGSYGPEVVANQYTYTKAEEYPDILKNLTNIQPQYSNTMRITNLTDITIETGAATPNGFRQLFGTATFANNATMFAKILSLAETAYQPVQNVPDFQASIVLQPMPRSITSRGAASGGNSLGLDGKEDLVWLDITVQWSSASSDEAINNATETLITQAVAYAKSEGLYNEYLYLNYALQQQDPIASYGQGNVNFLRVVSQRYDPLRVFQRLVPGGFKLWRDGPNRATCC